MALENFDVLAVGDTIARRYELKSVLNENNGEATIYICDYDSWICVAKVYHADCAPSQEKLDAMKSVESDFVIKKLDSVVYKNRVCEILPLFSNQNLLNSGNPITDKVVEKTIIPDILAALKEIHSKGLVHGNVRPTNIFFNALDFDVLLGDFGVSLENCGDCGPNIDIGYLAPECVDGEYGIEADYFSFGVSLIYLVTGKDPYDGLNKKQKLKLSCSQRFSVPEKAGEKVSKIIEGLTIRDKATRWGWEEIEKVLNGEDVEIVDNYVYEPKVVPFVFAGQEFTNPADLGAAFMENWVEAEAAIHTPEFRDFIEDNAFDLLSEVNNCLNEPNPDFGMFQLIYTLNPELPLCWKSMKFSSLDRLCQAVMNSGNVNFLREMMVSKAISFYASKSGNDEDFVSRISALEDEVSNGKAMNIVMFKFNYILKGDYSYNLNGEAIEDVDALLKYMHDNINNLDDICEKLLKDVRFMAWLEMLGYEDAILAWQKESVN